MFLSGCVCTQLFGSDEVGGVRQARDPIEYVKKLLVDYSLCTAEELKQMEKDIRNSVQDSLTKAKAGTWPVADDLYRDVFAGEDGKTHEPQLFIRTPDYQKSIGQIV